MIIYPSIQTYVCDLEINSKGLLKHLYKMHELTAHPEDIDIRCQSSETKKRANVDRNYRECSV
jgi:hypothetical protein